jgi:hypothetical protein
VSIVERPADLFGAQIEARYADDQLVPPVVRFEGSINREITVTVSGHETLYFDALDLLRVVSYTVLELVYPRSATAGPMYEPEVVS